MISLEIYGKKGVGKTHLAQMVPNPVVVDCTPLQEALLVCKKLYPDDWNDRYYHVEFLITISNIIKTAVRAKRKSIVFDVSKELEQLVIDDYCRKFKKDLVYPLTDYHYIHKKIRNVLVQAHKAKLNIVFVSNIKNKYKKNDVVGKIPDSCPKIDNYVKTRIELVIEDNKRYVILRWSRAVDMCQRKDEKTIVSSNIWNYLKEVS